MAKSNLQVAVPLQVMTCNVCVYLIATMLTVIILSASLQGVAEISRVTDVVSKLQKNWSLEGKGAWQTLSIHGVLDDADTLT